MHSGARAMLIIIGDLALVGTPCPAASYGGRPISAAESYRRARAARPDRESMTRLPALVRRAAMRLPDGAPAAPGAFPRAPPSPSRRTSPPLPSTCRRRSRNQAEVRPPPSESGSAGEDHGTAWIGRPITLHGSEPTDRPDPLIGEDLFPTQPLCVEVEFDVVRVVHGQPPEVHDLPWRLAVPDTPFESDQG